MGNKKIFLFLAVFAFASPFILRAEEITLNLDEAIAIALRDNRDILLKRQDIIKAKEKIRESRSGLLPALSFTASWTDTRGFYPKDKAAIKTQTGLKQYLYQGGEVINTIRYNEGGLVVAEALLDKEKSETLFNVQKAFYTLLLANGFADVNKKILANVRAHLESKEERFLNGQASQSDILSIKKALSNIEEAYEESLNQADSSQSLLSNLLHMDADITIKPEAEFVYEPKDIAYDEAFLKAMKERPEIRQYEAAQAQAKTNIEIVKAGSRPSIYASWDYYSNSLSQLTFSPGKAWNDYNVAGLTFSWPIFDGWETRHKLRQAIADLKQAQFLKEKIIGDIALEVKNAYLALKNSLAAVKTAESDLAVYEDNVTVIKQKYEDGMASFLDLDDVNLSYEVSAFNKNEAIYDYIIAKCDFTKATGGL